ncbi:MAG: hypothetical protein ACI91B_001082 [Planctomycetota bacterium]|jgi:hypothetical protein
MARIVIGVVLTVMGIAHAQQVTVIPRAPAPLTAGVVYGGQPYNDVVPSGPLPFQGSVYTSSPFTPGSIQGAQAMMYWNVATPATLLMPEVRLDVSFSGMVSSHIGPSVAALGTNDLLFDVSATTPRNAILEINLTGYFVGASQWPTWEVDVGDDGSTEAYFGNGATTVPLQLGTQPVPIRVRCAVAIGTPNPTWPTLATMYGNLEMKLTPDNHIHISEVVATCGVGTLECREAFDHDGVVFRDIGGMPLKVLVLGMQAAPVPFWTGVSTCVLWPATDVLIGPISTLDLPIPAIVRPFQFYAQSVYAWNWFGPQASASQALRITAY